MNIVKPYAKIISIDGCLETDCIISQGIKALQKIEWCGRISHRSEDKATDTSFDKFIRTVVLGHGDWSIVEHASATVDFLVDRGITHEIVRHRLFSYTQESTRFVNYEKKMPASFIKPEYILGTTQQELEWEEAISSCELSYKNLIKLGAPPQIARSVFPNALASRIIMTGNLRSWRHFFIMRTTQEAHPQMREVTIPLLQEFQDKIPILFEDIVPLTKQSISMARMK